MSDAGDGLSTASFWEAETPLLQPRALVDDMSADVCVVGAGIAGLTAAYLLAKAGRRVVVIDDGPVGGGETRRTTAHLSCVLDAGLRRIERLHGLEGLRAAVSGHAAAIDLIEAVAREEGIACGFERVEGYLVSHDGDPARLREEREAAGRAGLEARLVEKAALGGRGPALRFPRQAQFHPLRYLHGLARRLESLGVGLCAAHATDVAGGDPCRVQTKDATIAAGAVVVAANVPVNDRVTMHTKQASYRTYVIEGPVPRGAERALLWDTEEPYHYARLHPGEDGRDALIVGGEDHKTGQADDPEERFARLEAWARQRFPALGAIRHRWSGQVVETVDGLGFLGRNPSGPGGVHIITGDCGMGMTNGTLGALVVSDLILGKTDAWAATFDPSRRTLRAAGEYLRENANAGAQYTDWLTRGEAASADDIPPGSGAVIRRGLRKVAVFRDERGALHERSAVCPHLGGVVCWNPAERSWDCPVHGSRFSAQGTVLNGPAISNLRRLDHADEEPFELPAPPPGPQPPPDMPRQV